MALVTTCRPPCGNATVPLPEPPAVWVPTAASAAAATNRPSRR